MALSNDIEQHPADYANLQTASSYHNGYPDASHYMINHQYQPMYFERPSAENSPPSTLLYRDDPNLAASSRYQVSYETIEKI